MISKTLKKKTSKKKKVNYIRELKCEINTRFEKLSIEFL